MTNIIIILDIFCLHANSFEIALLKWLLCLYRKAGGGKKFHSLRNDI